MHTIGNHYIKQNPRPRKTTIASSIIACAFVCVCMCVYTVHDTRKIMRGEEETLRETRNRAKEHGKQESKGALAREKREPETGSGGQLNE